MYNYYNIHELINIIFDLLCMFFKMHLNKGLCYIHLVKAQTVSRVQYIFRHSDVCVCVWQCMDVKICVFISSVHLNICLPYTHVHP